MLRRIGNKSFFVFFIFAILFLSMPVEATQKHDLTEITKLDPTFKLDIRYATKNNFLGRPVYKETKAFLQKSVLSDLIKVNKELRKDSYGLLIFDAYRPWSVTKIFWDEIEPSKRKFVADPKVGSIHNRGCAVDLTLYDLKSGKEIKMPSGFDTFNESAYPVYTGGTKEERTSSDFLTTIMKKYNFMVHPNEWWHYDYKDCMKYPILDLTFEEIVK